VGNQMFSPQENEPRGAEERQANTDPREQGAEDQIPPEPDSSAYSSYEEGYRGYDPHMEGEKLRPSQSISSKQWIWIIIAVLVLLVVGGSVINSILGSVFFLAALVFVGYVIWRLAFNQAVQLPVQSFEVSGRTDLIVDNPFGAIRIHRGSVDKVEVRGTRYYSSLFPSRPSYPLNATQQGNQVKVEVWSPQARRTFTFGDFGRIDLEIVTPEFSDVHIRSDASAIAVDSIQGQAFIRTNAGTIDVKNASLASQSFAHTNAGTITVQNVNLEGNARMESNAGTISFAGSVKPGGHYSFETNAGTIDVALAANTAFVLDAKTDLGTVSNQFGNTGVGVGPPATLHLRTHLGTISVKPLW
jgi:Putative adhesin